jgi:hypothetical protein
MSGIVPSSTIRLMIPKRSRVLHASRSMRVTSPRTGSEVVKHAKKLAHRHLFAVDVPAAASGGAELVELNIEGLPVGANAGFEVMRALRKSQTAIFNITCGIRDEARFVDRAFGRGASELAEAVQFVSKQLEFEAA